MKDIQTGYIRVHIDYHVQLSYGGRCMREIESNMILDIKVHEFVNKSTWNLHLALHVNNTLVSTAKANLGNSACDYETVVAAMKKLKNDYFKAIGSPMRYRDGKLVFMPADQGMLATKYHAAIDQTGSIPAPEQTVAISH